MKILNLSKLLPFAILLAFSGCGLNNEDEPQLSISTFDFDFNNGQHDWIPGFADYPANTEDSTAFELKFEYTESLPSILGKRSVMLSGKNINRDLFMYVKKKISNLQPNTDYTITFNVELTTDLQEVQPAGGGSVYLKAGATYSEPKSVIEGGKYVMNIDKGNQEFSGEDMITLGDLFADGTGTAYALVTRSNTMANSRYVARTNSNGELWLVIGTDSSVSGTTKIFYTRIKALFSVS